VPQQPAWPHAWLGDVRKDAFPRTEVRKASFLDIRRQEGVLPDTNQYLLGPQPGPVPEYTTHVLTWPEARNRIEATLHRYTDDAAPNALR